MIRKYRIGEPIPTDAPVKVLPIEASLPDMPVIKGNTLTCPLKEADIVYGLGEALHGINKRGHIYESKCSDEPNHWEDKTSLYGAHNFLLISGEKLLGIFIDTPGIVNFDVGFTSCSELNITFEYPDYDLYLIEGDTEVSIIREFRELIGESYVPPKWAFGYGQSRWSYNTTDEVREVVNKYKENYFPIDSVYLDIDYMEKYKDFTINEETFPDFESFVSEMKNENIHIVPIIDAGVKIEEGYNIYEEGVKNSYFCKKEDGSNLICGVWPGDVHFPDFLNEDARKWFGSHYDFLISKGIDGFWNDMNEPAIFYAKDRLNAIADDLNAKAKIGITAEDVLEIKPRVNTLENNREDYKTFYHNYKGKTYRHDRVHNLYGFNMTRAAGEYFSTLDKDILMFSRASYIGAHRYGGIWQGDNNSCWSHLKLNMDMTQSLNMAGFLFTGADVGGFSGHASEELVLRWLEFAVFTPLFRNHSAIDTRRQELYEFDNMADTRNILGIRYGLINYIYDEVVKAAKNNTMYMRPLAFDYRDDTQARRVDDQILVGESIMIAPVYTANTLGRYMYLPEKMKMLRLKSLTDIKEEVIEKGHHYIDVATNELLIFIRKGKSLELTKGGMNVNEAEKAEKMVFGF